MIIQTSGFPVEGKEFILEEPSTWGSAGLKHGPVTGRIRVERSGDYFFVRGEVETTVIRTSCVRKSTPFWFRRSF